MIKFFRHIRRSLIQKNQMGKYFKYAIGEILLVVIGILIALQINNWNEDRKLKKEERATSLRTKSSDLQITLIARCAIIQNESRSVKMHLVPLQ